MDAMKKEIHVVVGAGTEVHLLFSRDQSRLIRIRLSQNKILELLNNKGFTVTDLIETQKVTLILSKVKKITILIDSDKSKANFESDPRTILDYSYLEFYVSNKNRVAEKDLKQLFRKNTQTEEIFRVTKAKRRLQQSIYKSKMANQSI